MIRSIGLARLALPSEQFDVLVTFLREIGFDAVLHARYAYLHAPQFRLLVNRLRPSDKTGNLPPTNTLSIGVTNPEFVRELAERHKLPISNILNSTGTTRVSFLVDLPRLTLEIRGEAESPVASMEGSLNAAGRSFAVVVARFNSFITERLLAGALDGLLRSGANKKNIALVRVPGAFEIPSAARTLAETKKYDAIICLGCLIRGDTAHYDVIVNEVTRGIGQSAQETGVPHAFGVLTCDTLEQAIDRAGLKMGNKGFEAALAAIEMANLKQVVSEKQIPRTSSPQTRLRMARNDKMAKVRNDNGSKIRNGKSKKPSRPSKSKKRK